EENGVRGVYRYNRTTSQRTPVTNFSTNIQDFDFNTTSQALALVSQVQARDILYLYPKFETQTTLTLGKTARQQTLEARSQPAPAPVRPAPAPTPSAAPGSTEPTTPTTTTAVTPAATEPAATS